MAKKVKKTSAVTAGMAKAPNATALVRAGEQPEPETEASVTLAGLENHAGLTSTPPVPAIVEDKTNGGERDDDKALCHEMISKEAVPVEAAPVEAAPVEAAPVEAAPVEAAPVEAAPVEAAPVEAAPVEAAPVEAAPVEAAPVEPKGALVPTPSAPNPTPLPTKRLTLQERLALAAKGKKKAGTTPLATPLATPVVSPRSSIEGTRGEAFGTDTVASIVSKGSASTSNTLSGAKALQNKLPGDAHSTENSQGPAPPTETPSMTASVVDPLHKDTLAVTGASLHRKLAEQNLQISNLLDDCRKATLKEFKLNETIRKLKAAESSQAAELEKFHQTNQRLQTEMAEMASHQSKAQEFDAVQTARVAAEARVQALDAEVKSLSAFKLKYLDQVEETKAETLRNKSLNFQLNDLKNQIDTVKRLNASEIASLKLKVEREKLKLVEVTRETDAEIKRLEGKVEELRYRSETASSVELVGAPADEFLKLQSAHESLHSQYTAAQENWKLIESQLMNRVADFEGEVLNLAKKEQGYQKKVRLMTQELKKQADETEKLREVVRVESAKTQALEDVVAGLKQEAAKTAQMKEIYESETRAHLTKIADLERELRVLGETVEELRPVIRRNFSDTSGITMEEARGRQGGLERPVGMRRKISDSSGITIEGLRMSRSGSVVSVLGDEPRRVSEYGRGFDQVNRALDSPVRMYDPGWRASDPPSRSIHPSFHDGILEESLDRESLQAEESGSAIQMVEKMSLQVRRLEIELATVKEEQETLSNEKQMAQETIIRLMSDTEAVEPLRQEVEALSLAVKEKEKREQTMLEIIGEKEDLIAELRYDVADLKEICQQQAQAMAL